MLRIDLFSFLCYIKHEELIFMMCPYCQNEMEEGYIPFNSPFVLKWVSMIDKKKVRISDKIKWSEVAKIKNIHYCKECCVFIKKI